MDEHRPHDRGFRREMDIAPRGLSRRVEATEGFSPLRLGDGERDEESREEETQRLSGHWTWKYRTPAVEKVPALLVAAVSRAIHDCSTVARRASWTSISCTIPSNPPLEVPGR
jgi:hypothetical protein